MHATSPWPGHGLGCTGSRCHRGQYSSGGGQEEEEKWGNKGHGTLAINVMQLLVLLDLL